MLTPELKQNIFVMIYLLFKDNHIAFAYFSGTLISLFLSIKKPSRFSVFLLIGFIFLLFSYEYDKHIIEGLREQTLNSLITITPHYRLERFVTIFTQNILPVFFYAAGWFFVFFAIVSKALQNEKK